MGCQEGFSPRLMDKAICAVSLSLLEQHALKRQRDVTRSGPNDSFQLTRNRSAELNACSQW